MSRKLLILLHFIFATSTFIRAQGLDFYLNEGVKQSPLLKEYQNLVQVNSLDSAILSAQRKPQVNFISNVMVAPTYDGYGYDEAVTNGGNYAGLLSVSQDLLTKKTYSAKYESLSIEKQLTLNTAKISEHDLRKNITDQYLTAYSSYDIFISNQGTLKLLKDEELILQKFVQQGIYKETEYLSFKIVLRSEEILAKQSDLQYRNDLRELNLLCGIADTSYHPLERPSINKEIINKKSASPVFSKFYLDSLSIVNQKKIIDNNYRPKLNWFADGGIQGATPSLLYKNFGVSFGLNFVLPLYDGRQKGLQHQKLSINEASRSSYLLFLSKQFDQRIEAAKKQLEENEEMNTEIREQLHSAETLVTISKELLNKGELSVTDFILNIKSYNEIKSQLNQSELKSLQLANELNYRNW